MFGIFKRLAKLETKVADLSIRANLWELHTKLQDKPKKKRGRPRKEK